jgi:hypothetical protein
MEISNLDFEELENIELKVRKQLPDADELTILNALYADVKSSLLPENVKNFILKSIKETDLEGLNVQNSRDWPKV